MRACAETVREFYAVAAITYNVAGVGGGQNLEASSHLRRVPGGHFDGGSDEESERCGGSNLAG